MGYEPPLWSSCGQPHIGENSFLMHSVGLNQRQAGQAQCSAEERAKLQPQRQPSQGKAGKQPPSSSCGPLTRPFLASSLHPVFRAIK